MDEAQIASVTDGVLSDVARLRESLRESLRELEKSLDDTPPPSPDYVALAERVAAGELTWIDIYRGATDDPDALAFNAKVWERIDEFERSGLGPDDAEEGKGDGH
jgi:hypothetical protein